MSNNLSVFNTGNPLRRRMCIQFKEILVNKEVLLTRWLPSVEIIIHAEDNPNSEEDLSF